MQGVLVNAVKGCCTMQHATNTSSARKLGQSIHGTFRHYIYLRKQFVYVYHIQKLLCSLRANVEHVATVESGS